MNGRRTQSRKSSKFSGSHQRSWLWGRHAVLETLSAARWSVLELFVDERLSATEMEEVESLATTCHVRIQRASAQRIEQLCRAKDHQGILARMGEFPCGGLQEFVGCLEEQKASRVQIPEASQSPPLFVVCDRIQDVYNFGAILRCCDAMRVDAVIIGEAQQAAITPHAARSSAGAISYQNIFRVESLCEAVRLLIRAGVHVVAATEKADVALWDADLTMAVAVVLGSEAIGIDDKLLGECSSLVKIPMMGRVASLNVAVAAGIVLCECRRQQFCRR